MQTVDMLADVVKKVPLKVAHLHGECTQQVREKAVKDFKAGKCQILVATDVAARGLHIRNLPYIVNFDFPTNMDSYVHRCGRTGV
jgi:superfamily II DNA/RNA helicase